MIRDHNTGKLLIVLIIFLTAAQIDTDDFCRRKCIADVERNIRHPFNNIHFFAVQLFDHGLHAQPSLTDTGPDGIDIRVVGEHRNLGAGPCFSGNRHNFHNTGGNFRHLSFEQPPDQIRMAPRDINDGAVFPFVHLHDIKFHALVEDVSVKARLFIVRQYRFGTADVDCHLAFILALNDTAGQFADAPRKFFLDAVFFGLGQTQINYVFGGLCGQPAEILRIQFLDKLIADFKIFGDCTRFFKQNLAVRIGHFGNNGDRLIHPHLAGFAVDFGLDAVRRFIQVFLGDSITVALLARFYVKFALIRRHQRFFNGCEQCVKFKPALFFKHFQCFDEFLIHSD